MYQILFKILGRNSLPFYSAKLSFVRGFSGILFVCLLLCSQLTKAQEVTLPRQQITLTKLFKEIRKQTGYSTIWAEQKLSGKTRISVEFSKTPLEKVLDQALAGLPVQYTVSGTSIVIKAREPSFSTADPGDRGTITVNGVVIDTAGKPLPGTIVKVENQSIAYRTDNDGRFRIPSISEGASLVISYVGYQTLEMLAKENLVITLRAEVGSLAEVSVVSTGYQTIPKERATGSFTQPNKEMFDSRVSTDVLSKLEGITSGMVFNSPGLTGSSSPKISIRGRSTIYANDNPLIVVDNFPYDGDIGNINPNDVENVTILKDAAAASIWGVQAGNGIIVITTKKGKLDQGLKVGFNSNITLSEKPDLYYDPNYLDAASFIEMERVLYETGRYDADILQNNPAANTSRYTPLSPVVVLLDRVKSSNGSFSQADADQQIDRLRNIDIRNDLRKYFYRKGVNQQYGLNLSGGTSQNIYYVSVGYDNNNSTLVGRAKDRLTINANNVFKPIRNLELSIGLNYIQSHSKDDKTLEQIFTGGSNGSTIFPYTQLVDQFGGPSAIVKQYSSAFVESAPSKGFLNWEFFPLQELNNNYNARTAVINDIRINTGLKYTLIKGLNGELIYQYQRGNNYNQSLATKESFYARDKANRFATLGTNGSVSTFNYPVGGEFSGNNNLQISHRLRAQLNYEKTIHAHSITGLAGYELADIKGSGTNFFLVGYDDALAASISVNPTASYPINPGGGSQSSIGGANSAFGTSNRSLSYFSNAAYTYLDKYSISGSARVDATNYFGVNIKQKFVPLWSAGASWVIDRENFFNVSWINSLRIRASYGFQGNMDKSLTAVTTIQYMLLAKYSRGNYASVSNYGNPDLRWEKTRMTNFGLDFTLLKNVLKGSVEYYNKKGIDLIGFATLAPTSGLTNLKGNYAGTKGRGVDINVNSFNLQRAFKWNTNYIFSWAQDKVVSYSGTNVQIGALVGPPTQISPVVGKPIYGIYAHKFAGLDALTGDPLGYGADEKISKDYANLLQPVSMGQIKYIGNGRPVFFGGISNRFWYNGIALSVNVSYKMDYFFVRKSVEYDRLFTSGMGHQDYEKRWQRPGDEALTNVPSMVYPANNNRDNFYALSENLVEKGDHIRLQDVSLTYDLVSKAMPNFPVKSVQVFAYANNLGILWKANKSKLDPDYPTGGFPTQKMWSFGIKAGL